MQRLRRKDASLFPLPQNRLYSLAWQILPQPRHPWYRLTPDREVIGLLALEGLLFLSERFRWFPLNAHKGRTVLICVAKPSVCFCS